MSPDSLFIIRDEPEPARFLRVVVERGIDDRGVDRPEGYVYAGDEANFPGERVVVPLGSRNRPAPGIVVAVGGRELLNGVDPRRVKRILRPSGASLPGDLLDLARWMSEYYFCPLGMVLGAMLPAAVKNDTGVRAQRVVAPVDQVPDPPPPGRLGEVWARIAALPRGAFPMPPLELAERLGLETTGPVTRLKTRGYLVETTRRIHRGGEGTRWEPAEGRADVPVTLTPDQAAAVEGIRSSLGSFSAHVLLGVTGSGKTEVFLRAMETIVDAVLVLVPEIALTPQTAGRFIARFRERGVAVLHSGMSAGERHRAWARAREGEARIVIGARSAVFAPVPRLGLVIVDEEHDASYKQDQLPRFSARDVAIVRAQRAGCPVVLSSATPSLETWAQAVRGRYRLWRLPSRVGGATLPTVRIVDLREERKESGRGMGAIGPTLARELRSTLDAGGQAILLLNRRGYASYVACPDTRCAWVMQCDHCDASMVVHRTSGGVGGLKLRCHHCLAEQVIPRGCPACGRAPIRLGHGTQKVEEELARGFPDLTPGSSLRRVDADTMGSARDYFETLDAFGRGGARVLLGTQMIAKGLDFPNVRLVGVVNADTALGLPDFRAAERTFQLVSQVAGRAGRGRDAGRVVVQTMNPREPAIVLASTHAYEAFAERELGLRREAGLPPATRMARIVVRDRDAREAERLAGELGERLRALAGNGVRLSGPMACPLARVSDHYRFAVEILAPTRAALREPMERLRREGRLKSDARTAVDVDPVALM